MDGLDSLPDPDLPLDELEARIARLAGPLNAAQHRFLVLIAEFGRRAGFSLGRKRFSRNVAMSGAVF